jgi:hypothetical protein
VVKSLLICAAVVSIVCTAPAAPPAWDIEVVDQFGPPSFTSLRVDNDGNVHVIYIAETDEHALRYGFWDHTVKRWFVMTVAKGANYCSLTLDSKQRPHISWADYGTFIGSKLRYGYWDGKTWNITALPLNSEVIDFYTSIALDKNDYPILSFYEYRGPKGTDIAVRMRVVQWNGKYWEAETIDGENQSGKYNALASDQQGRVHLAYSNVGAQTAGIRYAVRNEGQWTAEAIEDIRVAKTHMGGGACLTVDKQGNPHIVYANETEHSIRYAYRNGKNWVLEKVGNNGKPVYADRYAIALAEDGTPFVGYYDGGTGDFTVAWKRGSVWVSQVVDTGGAGFTSSMSIHQGQLWVSYADESRGALKVAHRDLATLDMGASQQSKR